MKKIVILAAFLVVTLGAVWAYATTITTSQALTAPQTSNIVIHVSMKVTMIANSDNACYAIAAKHENGDRSFGVSCDSTNIWWQSSTAGTALSSFSGSTSAAFSGWTTL